MNKKTYILGFIALVILVGVVWYGGQNKGTDQTASILGDDSDRSSGSVNVPGETDNDFVIGSPEAPVTIIEYSSHFCVHCANFHKETLPLLTEKYIKTGQVKLISRFVSPLEVNTAILCAEEENKFSEMSEYFFEHALELSSADEVKTMALPIVSDKEKFEECYDSDKYKDKIETWFDQATESGISGTPTFFINGIEIVGNQPLSIFEQAIEQALEQASE